MTRTDRVLMLLTIVGVLTYVVTWAVLGVAAPDYDPLRQAISELFDLGAPDWQRFTLAGVLLVTGVALLPVGPVFDRLMPGRGRLGPFLAVLAGLGTMSVAFFPCTAGCPGAGTTFTDTMHTILAGGGYVGLILAPLAFARRLWDTSWRDLAVAGLVLGGAATLGFVVRHLVDVPLGGLQQRIFNTLADAWYVLAAAIVLRRGQAASVDSTPDRASSSQHSAP